MEVCWVNKGTILDRVFECHLRIILFLVEGDDSCPEVDNFNWWLNAVFLTGSTGILNNVLTHFKVKEQNEY
jgi:hypothetical protein